MRRLKKKKKYSIHLKTTLIPNIFSLFPIHSFIYKYILHSPTKTLSKIQTFLFFHLFIQHPSPPPSSLLFTPFIHSSFSPRIFFFVVAPSPLVNISLIPKRV